MQKWTRLCAVCLGLIGLICLCGCASVKSNAAVCRIQFDYQDAGIEALNEQNLRALVVFKRVCE
ncbi:MAG: hypothetical protein SOT02_00590 [Elusimicrobiaceae bacterium]|uniref:hypothetical protein n=1 Tax=Candidatus Avelusimicrobium faecicola TaxID=3416205 RepID=UPI002A78AA8C|nr:hypothetical protein [Spirochaetota bacterium]MDY2939445.1 hypothetical protein [Elusimicrobiaceae bacterium]